MKTPVTEDISCFGYLWILLSLASSLVSLVGFYSPHWIQGQLLGQDVYFGSFRRCNYPVLGNTEHSTIEVISKCGRYSTFQDIPSLYWQISSVTIAVAGSMSLITSLVAFFGSFTPGFLNKKCARSLGVLQLMSGFLMVFGTSVYPLGFGAPEVRDACGGRSGVYRIGTCQVSWSLILIASGTIGLLVSGLLSFCSVSKKTLMKTDSDKGQRKRAVPERDVKGVEAKLNAHRLKLERHWSDETGRDEDDQSFSEDLQKEFPKE